MIGAIILFFIGLFFIALTLYFAIKKQPEAILSFFGASICLLYGLSIITESKNPTQTDVIDGKAIYQETQIITGNDTVKTYEIVWK